MLPLCSIAVGGCNEMSYSMHVHAERPLLHYAIGTIGAMFEYIRMSTPL